MVENPAALLHSKGVHVTAQRLAVLSAVSSYPHCTADDVATIARKEIGTISRQAVYDALAVLVEKGLIRRIQPAGSPARYEDRVRDNHHHLICRSCGRMVDADCAVGAAPCLTPADPQGFEIDEAEVIYWGRCSRCRPGDPARPELEKPSPSGRAAPHRSNPSTTDRATAHDQSDQPKGA